MIDLANTNGLVRVGQYKTTGYARAVHLVGNYAYLAAGGSLQVFDVSSPGKPVGVVSFDLDSAQPVEDVQVVANLAYLAAGALQIIDVTNPAQPTPLGQCPISEDAHALQGVGRYAYIAGGSWSEEAPGWRDGLMIVDVSDPALPTQVGGLSTPGWAAGLQVVGDQVYLADGPAGLAIVSLPTAALILLEEPQSDAVFYGSPAALVVGAYSAAPTNFQWYQGPSGDTLRPVAGATAASITIPAMMQDASYWVRVSSGTNSFDTVSATLTVVPIAVWGYTRSGLTNAPVGLTNLVAIAAGYQRSLALAAEGRVLAWGAGTNAGASPNYGHSQVPSGLSNVVAIAAGGDYSLVLIDLPPGGAVPGWFGPGFLVATVDRPFQHRIIAGSGATGLPSGLTFDPNTGLITGQPAQAGTYSMVFSATNSVGSTAWTVTLFVNLPSAPAIASSGLVLAGLGSGFNYAVAAYNVPEWYGAGGLPAGLVIDAQTGVISGVPLEAGDFAVSLVVSNRYGLGTGEFTLRVSSPGTGSHVPEMLLPAEGAMLDNGRSDKLDLVSWTTMQTRPVEEKYFLVTVPVDLHRSQWFFRAVVE